MLVFHMKPSRAKHPVQQDTDVGVKEEGGSRIWILNVDVKHNNGHSEAVIVQLAKTCDDTFQAQMKSKIETKYSKSHSKPQFQQSFHLCSANFTEHWC